MEDYKVVKILCEKLWDSEDPDCKYAEEYGFKDAIIKLLHTYYDAEEFSRWLVKNDCNPANRFREADIRERSDYDSDEDFEFAKDDCLFANDDYICVRW